MKKRVLISYASRCCSTGGVAEAMGQVLCGMGASADIPLVANVNDLSPYHAVIVGSAIRRGKWVREAVGFVKDNQDMLGRWPIAYFVVCLTMKDNTAENRSTVMAYLDPVRKEAPKIQPVAVGLFPRGGQLRQAVICGQDDVASEGSFRRRLPRLARCQSLGFRCRSDAPSDVVVRGYSVD